MIFPAATLVPRGGEMYSHIFENQTTGLARDQFWSITVHFGTIEYADKSWDCSMTSEWIRFGVRNWHNLDNCRRSFPRDDGLVESSFYMIEHDTASFTDLSLTYVAENRFRVRLEMIVDFHGYVGDDENSEMHVTAETEVKYYGLIVVPENLFPNPSTPQLVNDIAAGFVDLSAYNEPKEDRHRFLLSPKW